MQHGGHNYFFKNKAAKPMNKAYGRMPVSYCNWLKSLLDFLSDLAKETITDNQKYCEYEGLRVF
jgi:hypothetical protein